MYTEENERGRFPLRDILLKAIVVIIFLILIIFIVTKLTTKDTSTNSSATSNYDKTFSENLEAMEDATFKYYTKDRLPNEVGENNELTLREMINSNLLEAFTDADGNSCDVNNSYIRLTKNEDDYTLRVNLKCNKKEDYSLMKVGEYDYCEHDICKRDTSKEKNSTKEEKKEETSKVDITESSDTSNNTNTNTNANAGTNSNITNNSTSNPTNDLNTNTSSGSSQVSTMYEYKKVTNPVLSGWSSWSSWQLNNNRYTAVKCSDNDANCLREVQLYSRRQRIGVDSSGKVLYATVHYYSYRTRNLISSGTTDTKWSTYNDTNLINQGYTYTGNMR